MPYTRHCHAPHQPPNPCFAIPVLKPGTERSANTDFKYAWEHKPAAEGALARRTSPALQTADAQPSTPPFAKSAGAMRLQDSEDGLFMHGSWELSQSIRPVSQDSLERAGDLGYVRWLRRTLWHAHARMPPPPPCVISPL
eukprot:2677202-Prymnesium_polylepis.1